ncbi:MAG: 7-carboxy-7-deazaguanine synthase QueE [Flavobacteriaceae bacterium]
MEDFYTIQGEGFYTGVAAYFIRIGGCDVGCHWCDVKESWEAANHPVTSVEEMVANVKKSQAKIVVITGGEPLTWNMDFLTKRLKEEGFRIHIETSGAYPFSGTWDWVCLSPKKTKLPVEETYKKADELKIIIYNQHDFQFAEEQAQKVQKDCVLFLQAEWGKRDKMSPLIVDYVMNNPKWRISVQTHKYLDIP